VAEPGFQFSAELLNLDLENSDLNSSLAPLLLSEMKKPVD
jgi:hypothetical protein